MTRSGREDEVSGDAPAPAATEAAYIAKLAEAAAPSTKETPPQTSSSLEAARKSVEDAAAISGGLWLSYLFALFYIGIAAGGVTHRDLLLENPVKLPFLNVELPLVAFFFLAPILFVIVHAYTLVHFVLLAAKVGAYDQALRAELGDADDRRDAERRRLPSNIFVQFLAGPHEIREGGLGRLLQAIAWVSLVIGPVVLLLLIQAQFLPYHLEWVTCVQRFVVLADVILLWALWPAVVAGRSRLEWPRLWRRPVLTLLSLLPIGLAITARFPGEWLDRKIANQQWIPATGTEKTNITYAKVPQRRYRRAGSQEIGAPEYVERHFIAWTSFHDLLFNGGVDDVTRRRKSLFSNTLVLPGFDLLEAEKIDDEKKLEWAKHTFSLRGRHLEGSVFNGADLRKADLTGSFLQSAFFSEARLQDASFDGAQLQGGTLNNTQLQGASLNCEHPYEPKKDCTQLQGVSLHGAWLQGASFEGAQLQGASLEGAKLQGASFKGAELQGASLDRAELQGASLDQAQLEGASFAEALLQGADFDRATFVGTNMRTAALWRTNINVPSLTSVLMEESKEIPLSSEEFASLQDEIVNKVPNSIRRDLALRHISILDPKKMGPETNVVREAQEKGVSLAPYQQALARELEAVACSADENAIYALRGFYANSPARMIRVLSQGFMFILYLAAKTPSWAAKSRRPQNALSLILEAGPYAPELAKSILAPACPVSAELTNSDRAALRKIFESAPEPICQSTLCLKP